MAAGWPAVSFQPVWSRAIPNSWSDQQEQISPHGRKRTAMADMQALAEGLKVFALNGKAALVIGAEHPIGRVAAITLAEAGAKVLIASQNAGTENALKEVAKAIE